MSTTRHCPGCKGYTHASDACSGIPVSTELSGADLIVPDVVPPLRFTDRLRVLLGQPVLMGVAAGPIGEPFYLAGPAGEVERIPGEPEPWWPGEEEHFRDVG
jgi:hypothetical protein